MRAKATHGVDGRSEDNSTDSASVNSIGAHETGFGACVKRASGQVKRLQNLAGPTDGFHLGVMGNIVLCSDAFDSVGDHGAVGGGLPAPQFRGIGLEQVAPRAVRPECLGEPAATAADVDDRPPGQVAVAEDLPDGVLGDDGVVPLRVILLRPEEPQQPYRSP